MTVFALLLSAVLADRIAAIVGDKVIMESAVADNMYLIASDPVAKKMFTSDAEIRDYVLNELIAGQLMVFQAEAESITISHDELLARVNAIVENFKLNFPSEADFFKWLEERGVTVEDMKKNAEESERTKMYMDELIVRKWKTKILVSPVAVRRFYDEKKDSISTVPGKVKLAHILLPIRPSENEYKNGFAQAVEVYKLILAGGEFNVIAKEFSHDDNSRRQGGMLGKVKRGETLEEFENVIFALKPGVVSQPFPTRLGYHIVEVLNKGPDWVLARQILIKVETTRSDTARAENLANKIRAEVDQGGDFDSLAKKHSFDPAVDLGEYFTNQLVAPFDRVVAGLDQGKMSEPILTPVGYDLLYVREKTAVKTLTFEDLRGRIFEYLFQQELQKYYNRAIDDLKKKTFVKIAGPN